MDTHHGRAVCHAPRDRRGRPEHPPRRFGLVRDHSDEFLPARAHDKRVPQVSQFAQPAEQLEVVVDRLREPDPGVDLDPLARVIPVIEGIRAENPGVRVSIDTSKAAVAAAALDAGAGYVNDVTALRGDPDMAALVAERGADVCLMHMIGTPRTMQAEARYDDVVADVKAFLAERIEAAVAAGIARERIEVDPGIGFAKTIDHNLELLRRLRELTELGRPIVLGTSRKTFLGRITGRETAERMPATLATVVMGYERGAEVFRVHDVAPARDALAVAAATLARGWPTTTPRTTTTTT